MLPVAGDFGLLPEDDPPPPGPIPGQTATVTEVTEGDLIQVDIEGVIKTVRLIGIDAPEPRECYHTESRNRLTELIDGQIVTLVKDVSDTDRFGRLVRYVFFGTEHVNLTMVRQGAALESRMVPNTTKQAEFVAAQIAAFNESLGLWAACNYPPP